MGQLSLTPPPSPDIQLLQQEISASEELSQQLFLELVDLYSVQVSTHTRTHTCTHAIHPLSLQTTPHCTHILRYANDVRICLTLGYSGSGLFLKVDLSSLLLFLKDTRYFVTHSFYIRTVEPV